MTIPNSINSTNAERSSNSEEYPDLNGEGSSNSQYPDHSALFNTYQTSNGDWPALNEGEYKTDYFRMYKFKVNPCERTYVHVWSQCPNYHSGENARRRDPSIYKYSPLQCQNFRTMGMCDKGDTCEFAHGLFETWLHPGQYRTRVCREGKRCTRPMCFFAHDHTELRPIYKRTGCGKLAYSRPNMLPPSASASAFPSEPQPFMLPPPASACMCGSHPSMLPLPASTFPSSPQPSMLATPLFDLVDRNQHIPNIRIPQNPLSARSNSGLSAYQNPVAATTSLIPLVRSPESRATSDSYFNAGPFFDYDRMQ